MKYHIKMSCGHEEVKDLIGKCSERDRKIEYFETYGLCKECYKKRMLEKAKKEGLKFNATVLPYIDDKTGDILLEVWFDGDTLSHKNEIKSMGYYWGERESADDFFGLTTPPKCWKKTIKVDKLEEEAKKAIDIGAKSFIPDKGFFAMANCQLAMNNQKKWKAKKEKIASLERPKVPEVLRGKRWNQKIYGKSGKYSVYPDGELTYITDEQAEEIREYAKLKEEYAAKVKKIEMS